MLTKNEIKRVNSLRVKKHRVESGLFVAEGERLVNDIAKSDLEIETVYCTHGYRGIEPFAKLNCSFISSNQMKGISSLVSPTPILAVVKIPNHPLDLESIQNELCLALDDIQDPGNLGTIIRLADWFGIHHILCSDGTVDAFSPKVVQASMGSVSRVCIYSVSLADTITKYKAMKGNSVFGAFLDGHSIYGEKLNQPAMVVVGNEGNGISREVTELVSIRLHIPSFTANGNMPESLNAAMAVAIICSEFRRGTK